MDNRDEILQWMQVNATRLRLCADAMEMAELAVMCGATITLACEVLSQGHIDILTRSTELTRQKLYVGSELKQIEMKDGLPDLQELWDELANHLIWGDDFKEII